jgi:hypothetical protein
LFPSALLRVNSQSQDKLKSVFQQVFLPFPSATSISLSINLLRVNSFTQGKLKAQCKPTGQAHLVRPFIKSCFFAFENPLICLSLRAAYFENALYKAMEGYHVGVSDF